MKYSRQRELIREMVVQNPVHPTADSVYTLVREQLPSISLGTVYRNLNLLSDQGVLQKICVPGASDRFDGRLEPHPHIFCQGCNQVFDIELGSMEVLEDQLQKVTDFLITDRQVLLRGFCSNCRQKH